MRRLLSIALAALAVTACAPKPEIRIQTVHCVTPEQFKKLVAAMPPKVGQQLTGQAQKDVKIAAGSDVALREYASGLLDVLGGCTGAGA